MSGILFGAVGDDNGFIDLDTSTVRGTKLSARYHGYKRIALRFVGTYYVHELAELVDGKWVNNQYCQEMLAQGLIK